MEKDLERLLLDPSGSALTSCALQGESLEHRCEALTHCPLSVLLARGTCGSRTLDGTGNIYLQPTPTFGGRL